MFKHLLYFPVINSLKTISVVLLFNSTPGILYHSIVPCYTPLLHYLQSTTITSKDIMWRNLIIILVFLSALSGNNNHKAVLTKTCDEDARQLRRRARSLKHATSQTCRDGSTRSCTCTDGTMADLTSKPCPGGDHSILLSHFYLFLSLFQILILMLRMAVTALPDMMRVRQRKL